MSFPYGNSDSDDDDHPLRLPYDPLQIVTGVVEQTLTTLTELQDDPIEETQQTQAPTLAQAASNKENNAPSGNENKVPPLDLKDRPRWPQYKNLIKDYPGLTLMLLQSVDDADALNEVNAKNSKEIKGNKWAMLQYVCFGDGRGSLSPYLPHVAKATELKMKVLEVWKYCRDSRDPNIKKEVYDKAIIQFTQHLQKKKEVEEGKIAAKNKQEQLQKDMSQYERKRNAAPPGAKSIEAGRVNHSVNLRVGEPSSYMYAHSTEGKPSEKSSDIFSPQRTTKDKSPKASSSSGKSSMANEKAMADNASFEVSFSKLVDRLPGSTKNNSEENSDQDLSPNKIEIKKKLRRKRARHMKKADEYKPHLESSKSAKRE